MKVYTQKGNNDKLIINHKSLSKVFIKHVILLKADVNYTTFYLENGKAKVVAHTLKFFEAFLQTHGFLRVHRSFMINPDYLQEYNEEQDIIILTNGLQATISRRKKVALRELVK